MELLLPPLLTILPMVVLVLVPWTFFAVADLFAGFPRLRPRQVFGLLGLLILAASSVAFVYALEASDASELILLGGLVPILGWVTIGPLMFCGMWVREFRLLMLRRDDEFPGRSDKLAWIFALTILAPAGVWLFRSFRMARWPAIASPPSPPAPEIPAEAA